MELPAIKLFPLIVNCRGKSASARRQLVRRIAGDKNGAGGDLRAPLYETLLLPFVAAKTPPWELSGAGGGDDHRLRATPTWD